MAALGVGKDASPAPRLLSSGSSYNMARSMTGGQRATKDVAGPGRARLPPMVAVGDRRHPAEPDIERTRLTDPAQACGARQHRPTSFLSLCSAARSLRPSRSSRPGARARYASSHFTLARPLLFSVGRWTYVVHNQQRLGVGTLRLSSSTSGSPTTYPYVGSTERTHAETVSNIALRRNDPGRRHPPALYQKDGRMDGSIGRSVSPPGPGVPVSPSSSSGDEQRKGT
jgi:hypothetical protein